MKNKIKKILHGGAGLLEVLLAIGVMASLGPFVFKQINKQTASMRNIGIIRELENVVYALSNYMDANMPLPGDPDNPTDAAPEQEMFTGEQQIKDKLLNYGMSDNIVAIWGFFAEQHMVVFKKAESIEGFLVLSLHDDENPALDLLSLQEIASMIGPNAAVIDAGEVVGTTSEWGMSTDEIVGSSVAIDNGLVIQLSRGAGKADIYLNRVIPEKAAMYTDLYMGKTGDASTYKKIQNTGAVEVETLKGAADMLSEGEYPFRITELTKINSLEIADFQVQSPAQLKGPASPDALTIDVGTLIVSTGNRFGTDYSGNTITGEVGKFQIGSIDAPSSALISSDKESIMGNVKISQTLTSPPRIQTTDFTLANNSVFNNNITVIAKEIRSKEIKWGAKITADTIVTSSITFDVSGTTGELIDVDGIMYLPDLKIEGYTGYNIGADKKVSSITNQIMDDVYDINIVWECILLNGNKYPGSCAADIPYKGD
ncbi:MAG: hypothetical protein LBU68_01395, partial [Rickettsiales bacterium]|nr:hypothetical protein [Rickettsiales bacterium]